MDKQRQVDKVNTFLECLASHGRRFFEYIHEDGREVAKLKLGDRGHIFFWNEWKRKWIYVSRYGPYKGFHHGGTLHSLVAQLVEFIKTGKQLREGFFDANHWCYYEEMAVVVSKGKELGVILLAEKPICSCPYLGEFKVTGSACPLHGLPSIDW